ncbi:tetratricopeptide repeat protein [Leucothrix mucor]|uniref:tetratricopeptide repeat protein n=1 Tax=Leucothrix mucor TaxID=45248 RepID=UPI0003B4C09C|nr:tetratricopeptide repeat protein [Leucothrix mucor]
MTNRQSNIIFYGVIATVICGLIVSNLYPDFFGDMSKSKEELAIKEAVVQGNHNKALSIYQTLVDQRISDSNEFTIGTANMYEAMASLHALAGNKAEEKAHYLKSLDIKKQLKKVSPYSLAHTYFKLGTIAEAEQQYDQAQHYYEQSLSTKLVDIKPDDEEGFFEGMQNAQVEYKRLNHAGTIATFKQLGALHVMKKEYAIAKDYYEKALAASKLTFGDDDIKTLEVAELIKQLPR